MDLIYIMNDENTYEYSEMLQAVLIPNKDENQDITVEKGYRSTGDSKGSAIFIGKR